MNPLPHRPAVRRLLAVVTAGALLLGAAACSDDGGDGDGTADSGPDGGGDTSATLEGIATDVIVPSYETLVTDLGALGDAYAELCAAPGAEALEASREAWRAASTSWQASRPGQIGPAQMRRLPAAVDFRARPDPVEARLASDEPIDTESLRDEGSTFHGLSLMEELLFGEASADLETAAGARTCEFLVNVTPVSTDAVQDVIDDWTEGADGEPPYVETFAEGDEGDPVMSVDALANQIIEVLTAVDDNGLRDLAMAESLDDALSTRRDTAGAYVMAEHRAIIDTVATLVDGGFGDLVEARSADTAESLRTATEEAVAALAELPDSVDAAYTDDRAGLQAASEAVAALKVLMTTEVASQLGVTVRFSDADGDS